jgi:hypothetical protein
MILPSADSTGAQNHDRKPNGIPLDSVRPENALGTVRISEATFEVVAKFLPLTFGMGFDRVTDEKGDHRSEAKGIWK